MDKLEEEMKQALALESRRRVMSGEPFSLTAIAQACAVIARKQVEAMQLAMDEALHWLARGDIDEADRVLRSALHRKGVEPK